MQRRCRGCRKCARGGTRERTSHHRGPKRDTEARCHGEGQEEVASRMEDEGAETWATCTTLRTEQEGRGN